MQKFVDLYVPMLRKSQGVGKTKFKYFRQLNCFVQLQCLVSWTNEKLKIVHESQMWTVEATIA